MKRNAISRFLAGLAVIGLLAGCNLPIMPMGQFVPAWVTAGTATPFAPGRDLPPTQTPEPTLTPQPRGVVASYWPSDPQAPVLLYHHFIADSARADDTHIRLTEFRSELQTLYDNGYSLAPLDRWLKGDMTFTAGRRPIILTMDDLFFADQVFIQADGSPAPNTGIGILWQFYQKHPDFGFSVAMFANLGDKDYANVASGSSYVKGAGWEDSLARTIAWCIDHGAIPYNHFAHHPYLDNVSADKLVSEARDNDTRLQQLLELAGRPELFDGIANILALPYGHWPTKPDALDALLKYQNLQGKPVLGIVEVGGIYAGHYLQAVYSSAFDRNHLPRMVGSSMAMGYLTHYKDRFPIPQDYDLGILDLNTLPDQPSQQAALQTACQKTPCGDGVYALMGSLYRITSGQVTLLTPKTE
jgi:hypothetical protein